MAEIVARLRGLQQAAQELGVKPYQIQYAHSAGHVKPPVLTVFGKRIYDEAALAMLRGYFAGRGSGRGRPAARKAEADHAGGSICKVGDRETTGLSVCKAGAAARAKGRQ